MEEHTANIKKKKKKKKKKKHDIDTLIDRAAKKASGDLTEDESEMLKEALAKVFKEGMLPKDAMQFDDATMNNIYGYAYRLFNSGQYEEANHAFRLLTTLHPSSPKYMLGLAACYHMQKDWDNAIKVYYACAYIDPVSPLPYYHVADCFIQQGYPECAVLAYSGAIKRMGESPEMAPLKEKTEFILENLKKSIGWEEIKEKWKENKE